MKFISSGIWNWWTWGMLCLLLCTSCGRSYYHPTEAYLLGVSEAGELKAAVAYSGDRHFQQYQGQAAWSPRARLGLVATYFQQGDPRSKPESGTHWKLRNAEIAVGTYYKRKAKNNSGYLLFDGYVGMGIGQSKQRFNQGMTTVTANYRRYFINMGFHAGFEQHFQFSVGIRGVHLDYTNAEVFGRLLPADDYAVLDRIRSIEPLFLPEGSVRISGGFKKVQLYSSISGLYLSDTVFERRYDFANGPTIQGGLVFNLHEIFK